MRDAVATAATPNVDHYWWERAHATLATHGARDWPRRHGFGALLRDGPRRDLGIFSKLSPAEAASR